LRKIDIFSDIDMFILLPLASNIQIKKYKKGEYIVKAGEKPEGLIIVKEGSCIVCAEKIAMRNN
jgi:CRP-like cAMP-binding protein